MGQLPGGDSRGLVTLPERLVRPHDDDDEEGNRGDDNGGTNDHEKNATKKRNFTLREREAYLTRVVECALEYIEPPRPKALRRAYAGWMPGPGEEGSITNDSGGDDGDFRCTKGGDVTPYSPMKGGGTNTIHEDNDSASDDENDGGDDTDTDASRRRFEDHEGNTVHVPATPRRLPPPRPVRTVALRIRPDVLCGSVTDALGHAVLKVGGRLIKR